MRMPTLIAAILVFAATGCGAGQTEGKKSPSAGKEGRVKLVTLDPGHFHAALVQKTMYPQVDPVVHVYAPEGEDVKQHLARIEGYNRRGADPCSWREEVYTGEDFLERMLAEKAGNVVVLAGNNARKTGYIAAAVKAGLNVLSDKPMVISPDQFALLEETFALAAEKGVLLYDIMTERYEVTTMLQRELAVTPALFGELLQGTPDDPAITKESVHYFSKTVSGAPLIRPAWFFDTGQQGEGIVDVTTHLVDLIQWEAFPGVVLSKEDVELLSARRWSTPLTAGMFGKVTGQKAFPDWLLKDVSEGVLHVFSNGEIRYKLRGIHAKVSVAWEFEAEEGAGDTHFSVMRGSRCRVLIRQGREEGFKPTLYVEAEAGVAEEPFEAALSKKLTVELAERYPGLALSKTGERLWRVDIPEALRVGHEAHFAQVTLRFLDYLASGKMPEWEVPNMIVKYHTLTEALRLAGAKP